MKTFLRKTRAIVFKYLFLNPSKGMKIIGVTGTDGKSTTSEMIFQMLIASGKKTGIISTIGGKIQDEVFETGLHTSTPSSWEIYRALKKMHKSKVTHCVLELTSQGLDQYRACGIELESAVITNITPEHLYYHKTFEAYRDAKLLILEMLKESGVIAINCDDPNESYITKVAKASPKDLNIVYFSIYGKSGTLKRAKLYEMTSIVTKGGGYDFKVKLPNITFDSHISIQGMYNLQNLLGAVTLCIELGLPIQGIINGIGNVKNIAGRMSILQSVPFKVIVDFAHTENAFANILPFLRSQTKGKLIIMFGCPGERDHEKRKPMGRVASENADIIILTTDDIRNDNFQTVTDNIKEGIDNKKFIENKNLYLIQDRKAAVKMAISLASADDTVALLGKGHEKSIAIRGIEHPWNEEETALQYI